MTRRTAAAVRAAQFRREVEADIEPSRAKFERLFGDLDTVPESPKTEHVTRIDRGGYNDTQFVFRCSCHAFGKWRRKESQAIADAKAHVAKPWVKR